MVWRHDCEKLYYSNHFFGTKLDSHGNWTELHTDCGNNTMDPQPLVTREISYGLGFVFFGFKTGRQVMAWVR